jgi:hypothetical protein
LPYEPLPSTCKEKRALACKRKQKRLGCKHNKVNKHFLNTGNIKTQEAESDIFQYKKVRWFASHTFQLSSRISTEKAKNKRQLQQMPEGLYYTAVTRDT